MRSIGHGGMTSTHVGMSRSRLEFRTDYCAWSRFYDGQARRIAQSLGALVCRIEHIGSTAVPGLIAKPIVDIAVVVAGTSDFDRTVTPLERLGYRHRGQHGEDPLRRYFVLDKRDRRVAQLHLWAEPATGWREAAAFRDVLRHRADLRESYAGEKLRVAAEVGWDKGAYSLAKGPFVTGLLERWVR